MHYLKDRGYRHPMASEITPRSAYENRRAFLAQLAAGGAGAVLASWAARDAMVRHAYMDRIVGAALGQMATGAVGRLARMGRRVAARAGLRLHLRGVRIMARGADERAGRALREAARLQ